MIATIRTRFWTASDRVRQCWNPAFRAHPGVAVGGSVQELLARGEEGHQWSFLCACGKAPIEMKTLAYSRRCYDRRHHSLRFFGGMREGVLEHDRFRCRACGAGKRLLVHHRDRSNEPILPVTLCIRCHVRIHRSLGVRYWLSGLLLKLWRELHQQEPMQLQLALRSVAEKDRSEDAFEQARGAGASARLSGTDDRRAASR